MSEYRLDLEVYDSPPHARPPEVVATVFVADNTAINVQTIEDRDGLHPLVNLTGPAGGGGHLHMDSIENVRRLHRLLGEYLLLFPTEDESAAVTVSCCDAKFTTRDAADQHEGEHKA